jgi:hypothetical protein
MGNKKEPAFSLVLIPAPDEAPIQSAKYQTDLRAFTDSLTAHGIEFNSLIHFKESVSGGAFNLGEFYFFTIRILPILLVPLTVWIRARYRRKVKLKFKDVTAEATSVEEVEKLLKAAMKYRKKNGRR